MKKIIDLLCSDLEENLISFCKKNMLQKDVYGIL